MFIATQFVDGHTLRYLGAAQPRSWSEVVKIFADAGRGLAAAHEKDLVHRDFKPDNVTAATGTCRLMDLAWRARRWIATATPPPATVPRPEPGRRRPSAAGVAVADLDSTRVPGHRRCRKHCPRSHQRGRETRPHPGGRRGWGHPRTCRP